MVKNWGYIPTAVRVWQVLKNAEMKPVEKSLVPNNTELRAIVSMERGDLLGRADWLLK